MSYKQTQTLGGTSYGFVSWSDGGSATHTIATLATNTTYTATFQVSTGSGCDITGDGAVNALDLQRLINVILGAASSGNEDINHDGKIDVLDLQSLANVILGTATCP